jgi:hypothetical protein
MSVGILETPIVGKKKVGRPKSQHVRGEGKPVRIDPNLVGKAKLIASRRNLELGPYLSKLLEAPINRDYAAVLRELAKLEEGGK